MNKLKLLSIAAFSAMLFFGSCAKQDDPAPTDPGTTPAEPRARFHGTWSNSENSQDFGAATYNVTITDSSNASYIELAYLYGFNRKAYATFSGNSFSMPAQVIAGSSLSGSGTLVNSNQINMTYYVQSSVTNVDTVTAVLTK